MDRLDDIWITLDQAGVIDLDPMAADDPESLEATIEAFHDLRKARAVYRLLGAPENPLTGDPEGPGAVAVAATLGSKVDRLVDQPFGAACLRAGLTQLEAFVNYRVGRRVRAAGFFLDHPVVPGGALAPGLGLQSVLELLTEDQAGISLREGALAPIWSLAFFYPLLTEENAGRADSCGSCTKECALRK